MHREEFDLYYLHCQKFLSRTRDDIYAEFAPLKAEFGWSKDPVPFRDREKLAYKPIAEGERWGGLWESAYFHIAGTIPDAWRNSDVALYCDFSGEALIFDKTGCPIYGLTNGSVFDSSFHKSLYHLPAATVKKGRIDLWIEVTGNALFGADIEADPHILTGRREPLFNGVVKKMRLARINPEVEALLYDWQIAFGVLEQLPRDNVRARQLLALLNRAVDTYALQPANAGAARRVLKDFFACRATDSALKVTAVGHAHIDTGWLWPVRESIRKCARTFSSQITLMEQYPDYVFAASSPQHYQFVKDHYPKLYAKIKKRVAEGRWELVGGMWVEADCNLISGESMVRQFVHGKNFFMDEFGVEVKNLWLPDVFGYSAAMPQIMKKAGCDYFLTQKISWNKVNTFPFHSFYWRGIDHTEILTHFPPENNYNAEVCPRELTAAANRYNEAAETDGFLSLFGIGDGGGGPAECHLERALRSRDVEGLPKVKFGRADAFFRHLESFGEALPRWTDELYLELHRGTLTTQAHTKRNNRKCEQALAQVEFLWSLLPAAKYPAAELDKLWKTLLINQFHDIIPGSSINLVYQTTEKEHAGILMSCAKLADKALALLSKSDKNALALANTLGSAYTQLVELPAEFQGKKLVGNDGAPVPTAVLDGKLYAKPALPAAALTTLRAAGAAKNERLRFTDSAAPVLENELVRYEFNTAGEIVRAYDKEAKREVFSPGKRGNAVKMYADFPNDFEAWDVDVFYQKNLVSEAKSAATPRLAKGKLFSRAEFQVAVGNSVLRETATLAAGSKLLRFDCAIDYSAERRKLLRVEFPVDCFAKEATYDIQYGWIKRPTNDNTSWDAAKFEVVGQRYADLSDKNYGAAVLNDCKYAYRVRDGVIGLSLLRSPMHPDYIADQRAHVFTYAFLPHTGSLENSAVIEEAAMLNRAPAIRAGAAVKAGVPFRLSGGSVSLEVVKKAEKSDALVLRMVETRGESTRTVLSLPAKAQVTEYDLLEWKKLGACANRKGAVELCFRPFEIKTLLVR